RRRHTRCLSDWSSDVCSSDLFVGAGSCTVTVDQAGDANYAAAPQAPQSFVVGKATPTITWSNAADITYGTALGATQLNATASVEIGRASCRESVEKSGDVVQR